METIPSFPSWIALVHNRRGEPTDCPPNTVDLVEDLVSMTPGEISDAL